MRLRFLVSMALISTLRVHAVVAQSATDARYGLHDRTLATASSVSAHNRALPASAVGGIIGGGIGLVLGLMLVSSLGDDDNRGSSLFAIAGPMVFLGGIGFLIGGLVGH